MVTSLFKHDRIKTTDVKAKELRRWADQMVTLAKRGDLHARRQAMAVIRGKSVVHKLFEEAQERFGSRAGGYTRLTKLGARAGDGAPMTMVELVSADAGAGKKKKKKGKKKPVDAPVTPASKKQPEAAAETATASPETAESPAAQAPDQTVDTAEVVETEAAAPEPEPEAAKTTDTVPVASEVSEVDDRPASDDNTSDGPSEEEGEKE